MKNFKKVIGLFMLCSVLFSMSNLTVLAKELTTQTVVNQDGGISTQKVDTAGTISLGRNEYFTEKFTMKPALGSDTPHNAFTVKISDIEVGDCIVTITGSNGYSWTSSNISSGSTIRTTGANPTATYTVKIKAGYDGCLGKYSITSYIE